MGPPAMFEAPEDSNPASFQLGAENIQFIEMSVEWTSFRDDLAARMFTEWEQAS